MKLAGLRIQNYGCIDQNGVDVLIDNIVVLIGSNNAGKSTVLEAYEAFASSGEPLSINRFHGETAENPVAITGVFTELTAEDREKIGDKWIHDDAQYGQCIRYRWSWSAPDTKGEKSSWDATAGAFSPKGMGGWDSIIASCIPVPLRINPLDSTSAHEAAITEILSAAVKAGLKKDTGRLATVVEELTRLTAEFSDEVADDVEKACGEISARLAGVFPKCAVEFQPALGKFDAEKAIGSGHIRVKTASGESIPLTRQGTGLQRAFLWSALGALAELGHVKKGRTAIPAGRPRILLIDEPESFLHPPSVRAAREALYAVAELDDWQVMATTHSPVFIDVSKPHTSIVRIGRDAGSGSRIFSTERSTFDGEERSRLRMIRACHPTVNEFFFADHVVLVEGETEHTVLSVLFDRYADQIDKHFHVVNCMGKANIPLFARILNQFQTPYTIIHDSDSPKIKKQGRWENSGMWTVNTSIMTALKERPAVAPPSFVIAHIPDFEGHYFGERLGKDKPYHALSQLSRADFDTAEELKLLREFPLTLANGTHPGLYSEVADLTARARAWAATSGEPVEQWSFDD